MTTVLEISLNEAGLKMI